jgi:hypothetical protein
MNCLQFFVDMLVPNSIAGAIQLREAALASGLFAGLLHLADFRLDLARYFFAEAFDFQAGVVCHLADLLLDLALHFVNFACDLVLSA